MYSEDALIEQTCVDILQHQLGWKVINAYQNETFGEQGELGRNSIIETVLLRSLKEALKKLNPGLSSQR